MSDQDFFFDEDEPKDAEPVKVSAPKPAGKAKAAAVAAAPAAQGVSVAVASLIGVVALLAGLIVGILLPIGGSTAVTPTNAATSSPAGQTAPQLSNEQMQTGELPSGHPDISGMSGSTGTSGTTGTGK